MKLRCTFIFLSLSLAYWGGSSFYAECSVQCEQKQKEPTYAQATPNTHTSSSQRREVLLWCVMLDTFASAAVRYMTASAWSYLYIRLCLCR